MEWPILTAETLAQFPRELGVRVAAVILNQPIIHRLPPSSIGAQGSTARCRMVPTFDSLKPVMRAISRS